MKDQQQVEALAMLDNVSTFASEAKAHAAKGDRDKAVASVVYAQANLKTVADWLLYSDREVPQY